MGLTVECYGMILFVYKGSTGEGRMLLFEEHQPQGSKEPIPAHHAVLIAEADDIDSTRLAIAPDESLPQLLDIDHLEFRKPVIWPLTNYELRIGSPGKVRLRTPKPTRPRVPENDDWTDYRWLADLQKIHPESTIPSNYTLGRRIKREIKLPDGELGSGKPHHKWEGADWVWGMSPAEAGVVTDHGVFKCDHDHAAIGLVDSTGREHQVMFADNRGQERRLCITHEATRADRGHEAAVANKARHGIGVIPADRRPYMKHFVAFYDVIENAPYISLGNPVALWKWQERDQVGKDSDTPYCIVSFMFE